PALAAGDAPPGRRGEGPASQPAHPATRLQGTRGLLTEDLRAHRAAPARARPAASGRGRLALGRGVPLWLRRPRAHDAGVPGADGPPPERVPPSRLKPFTRVAFVQA